MKLYSAEICPFAQRTRALLLHLDAPYESREIDLRNKAQDFTDISPTGKVPLLVDDTVLLYESSVINEYLADKLEFAGALPEGAGPKARMRLAMKQFDLTVLPAFYRSVFSWGKTREIGAIHDAGKIDAELAVLEQTLSELMPEAPSLALFHFGPFWRRMDGLRELSQFADMIDARPALRAQFDRASEHTTVVATGVPPDELLRTYREYAISRAS
jgi:glutathione S-transferase